MSTINESPTTPGTRAAASAVRVRGLTKTYGQAPTEVSAVRGIDLDVNVGEVLLVMGPSGSGKTTLLLMLGALLRPTEGSIVVYGRDGSAVDIATEPEKALPALRARTFGFIFQDYALLDALTATENIAVAANLAGTTGAAATTRAHHLLERVGLGHRSRARPLQLSGGEQQRVAVARALANDPPSCWPTSPPPTSTPHADVTWPDCCARSPTTTGAVWSSSATTTASATSPTGSSGLRMGSSQPSPPERSTRSAGCRSNA